MPRAVVALIPLVLVPALGATQGGFHPDTWVWSGALAAWAAALGITVGVRVDALRRHGWWPVIAAALLLWTVASAIWSAVPAQSVLEARRSVVYAAVVLALVVLARKGSARVLFAATDVAVVLLVIYALGRYLLGPRQYSKFEGYLLAQPLGYADGVGILAAAGIVLSLGPATGALSPRIRAAAAAALPALALALDVTGSDASWLALGIGVGALIALHPTPLDLLRSLALLAPATAVLVFIGGYSDVAGAGPPRIERPAIALIALAGAVVSAVTGSLIGQPRPGVLRVERPRRLAAVAAVVIVIGGTVSVASRATPQPRSSYYHVAWHEFESHPLLGSGAGTFGRYWLESGRVARWGGALDAHSLYLETLAELGPLGLCLVLGLLLYPLRRVAANRDAPFVPAAAGAAIAFLVHATFDWDWELPAVVVAGLCCSAVVAFADLDKVAEYERPPPLAARLAVLAAALALGAAAIAGVWSHAEPSASKDEAPVSGASSGIA